MSVRKLAQSAFVLGVLITLYQALTRRRRADLPGGTRRDGTSGPLLG